MNNSVVEQDFIDWCKELHPNINPYIFLHRYNRYYEEYLPLIEEHSTQLHQYLHNNKSNVNFVFKGRIKSKRSFLIKTFINIAKNTKILFDKDTEPLEREKKFEKFFKFLLKDNPERYNKIKQLSFANIPIIDDFTDCFSIVFNKLSQSERDKLISRLGRTEDTYAYRLIVNSVDFPFNSIYISPDSKFYIVDKNGNNIPINVAKKIDPKKDIIHSSDDGLTYVVIDGKKELLNEKNLLYSSNLSASKHTLQNAQKDENGNITLLSDSIILPDNTNLDIIDIYKKNDNIYILDSNDDIRNLNVLLNKSNSLSLRKHDEDSLIKEVYDIYDLALEFNSKNKIYPIKGRFKDYIATPKPDTKYMSLHNSSYSESYGYTEEGQYRTMEMEDTGKNEDSVTGHDNYKKSKLDNLFNNSILAKILKDNPTAFDSSSTTLMNILENRNVELSELLGRYLLTTTMSNGISVTYQPPINIVFEHIFENASSLEDSSSSETSLPKLNFNSYEDFIASRKARTDLLENNSKFPDIYDD